MTHNSKGNIFIESHSARPGYSKVPHRHSVDSLLYVVSGKGRCTVGESDYMLSPDTVILLKRGCAHRIVDRPGHSMLIFVLYFDDLDERTDASLVGPLMEMANPHQIPPHFADEIKGMIRRMIFEQESRPPEYIIALEQCLSAILLRLFRISLASEEGLTAAPEARKSHQRVSSVLDYVKANYYERHDLASVSKAAGLSQRQFSNVCRQITSLSFVKLLNKIRTSRAMDLVKATEMPVSAIAFEVGYEELSTFYRAFKQSHGRSPLSFR